MSLSRSQSLSARLKICTKYSENYARQRLHDVILCSVFGPQTILVRAATVYITRTNDKQFTCSRYLIVLVLNCQCKLSLTQPRIRYNVSTQLAIRDFDYRYREAGEQVIQRKNRSAYQPLDTPILTKPWYYFR